MTDVATVLVRKETALSQSFAESGYKKVHIKL